MSDHHEYFLKSEPGILYGWTKLHTSENKTQKIG